MLTMQELNIPIVFLTDRNACVAEAEFATSDTYVYTETGSSKREPGEPFSESVAQRYAAARLLRKLADRFEEAARSEIDELESRYAHPHAQPVSAIGGQVFDLPDDDGFFDLVPGDNVSESVWQRFLERFRSAGY